MRAYALSVLLAVMLAWPLPATADEPPRAAIVVRFGDGRHIVRIVSFEGDTIRGMDLLRAAGLGVVAQNEALVCKIGPDGCDYPEKKCVCGRDFWSYWHYTDEGWTFANQGAASHTLCHGEIDGWSWGSGQAPDMLDPGDVYDEQRLAAGLVQVSSQGPAILVSVDLQGDTDEDSALSARLRTAQGAWQRQVGLERGDGRYVGRVASELLAKDVEIAFAATDPDGVRGSAQWTVRYIFGGDAAPRLPLIGKGMAR